MESPLFKVKNAADKNIKSVNKGDVYARLGKQVIGMRVVCALHFSQ